MLTPGLVVEGRCLGSSRAATTGLPYLQPSPEFPAPGPLSGTHHAQARELSGMKKNAEKRGDREEMQRTAKLI